MKPVYIIRPIRLVYIIRGGGGGVFCESMYAGEFVILSKLINLINYRFSIVASKIQTPSLILIPPINISIT